MCICFMLAYTCTLSMWITFGEKMTLESGLTILAIVFAPLVALQVSEIINEKKEAKKRRLAIFRRLMSTRNAGPIPSHVEALNSIDVEFHNDKLVNQKWREYLDHLSDRDPNGQPNANEIKIWDEKRAEMLIELLIVMAETLGYKFDKVHLKRGHYFPQKFVDDEMDGKLIRMGVINLLQGRTYLNVNAVAPNQTEPQEVTPEITE